MAIFDPYIVSVNNYIEELKGKGRQVRERSDISNFTCPNNLLRADGNKKAGASIVLKADTFLELGSPAAGSCAVTIYSDHPKLLQDGRITLIGPDVKESPSALLPFGQVIIAGGEDLNDNDYYHLLQYQNLSDQIEGYMIKSTPENIWSRVSNEASQKGFNFGFLGAVLMRYIKASLPKIQSVEVLFITSSKEDVMNLDKIGAPVRDIAQKIKENIWKDRGVDIYQCAQGAHCGLCEDKAICDEIKQMRADYRKSS